MAWRSVPNFGDDFAKVREREHLSGVKAIEVLHGR